MIYKTGHRDFPSISTYTDILHNEGTDSAKAAAYLARFLTDEQFVEQAKVVKTAFDINKNEKKS